VDVTTTWDGLPIAEDPPHGSAILVYRWRDGGREWLVLHRAHQGPDYEGDWAWGSPSGARLPGEPVVEGAARELREETGLVLPLRDVDLSGDWALFLAEAPGDAEVRLSAEHDAWLWAALPDALPRIAPAPVAASLERVAGDLPRLLPPDASGLAAAAGLLREGAVVAFPTDTVYGLAGLAREGAAAERIYEIKRRPRGQQLIAMAAEPAQFEALVAITDRHRAYMKRFWPGPLTLVLPALAAGGAPTLGLRVPDHPLALALLRQVGEPLLTTSANLSGESPAMTAQEAARLLGVAAVLDGGDAPGGVASTVASLVGEEVEVLRRGPISRERLEAVSVGSEAT
jgi:tRNA threonylcarbamoyl adenosine modification protein (Sua5/YciO/YrdC/YwlC family)